MEPANTGFQAFGHGTGTAAAATVDAMSTATTTLFDVVRVAIDAYRRSHPADAEVCAAALDVIERRDAVRSHGPCEARGHLVDVVEDGRRLPGVLLEVDRDLSLIRFFGLDAEQTLGRIRSRHRRVSGAEPRRRRRMTRQWRFAR
jgi:hypothetical protein